MPATLDDNKTYQKAYGGISNVEYILIAVFVLLICVAGFKMLNANFGNALAEVKGDLNSHSAAAKNAVLVDQASLAEIGTKTAANIDTITSSIGEAPLPDIGNLSTELGNMVATSGANGATTVLTDQLSTLAQQLLSNNKITQAQYNTLIALANQGHNLARLEQQYETIVANSRSVQEMDQRLNTNPELVAFDQNGAYYLLGFNYGGNNMDPVKDPLKYDPNDQTGSATQDFLTAYQNALKSGVLDDPATKQTIDALAGNIAYISHMVGAATGQVSNGQLDASQMKSAMASAITHQNSADICSVGSGKDSETGCTASSGR